VYVSKKPDTANETSNYLLQQDPPLESSLLAVDPQSGAVLAMVGGFAFEKSMFNRVTQSKRQTGSVIKPIVYSAAMESGQQPMTKVLDAPIISTADDSGMVWRPRNNEDRYYGETTLKEGLTRSRNIVTIRTSEMIGIRKVMEYIRRFGITSEMPMDMSITIGSGSVSLMEMVYAYSAFPNMGTRVEKPYFVTKIEDSDGNVLYDIPKPQHVEVMKPATAQVMTDILVNVVEKGTAFRAKAITRPVGAKTGTSNEGRDAWFMGFMPNLAVGVWAGFDDFGSKVAVGYGSQNAGPTWVDFVVSVLPYVKPAVFPVAEDVEYKKVDIETWEPTDELNAGMISFEPYLLEDAAEETTDNVSAGL
jgi:penicillin-binding protein 1A